MKPPSIKLWHIHLFSLTLVVCFFVASYFLKTDFEYLEDSKVFREISETEKLDESDNEYDISYFRKTLSRQKELASMLQDLRKTQEIIDANTPRDIFHDDDLIAIRDDIYHKRASKIFQKNRKGNKVQDQNLVAGFTPRALFSNDNPNLDNDFFDEDFDLSQIGPSRGNRSQSSIIYQEKSYDGLDEEELVNPITGEIFYDNCVDLNIAYTHRSPYSTYKSIYEVNLKYTHQFNENLSVLLGFAYFNRHEGDGVIFNAGAYRNWTELFYTFTSVTVGNVASYLPKFRFDHDFNYKFGKEQNIVATIGGTYFQYHHDANFGSVSIGALYYMGKWIFGYRGSLVLSQPGSMLGWGNKVYINYGEEYKHRSFFEVEYGLQNYLVIEESNESLAVSRNAVTFSLNHRHWLQRCSGFNARLSYSFLPSDSYGETRLSLGAFRCY